MARLEDGKQLCVAEYGKAGNGNETETGNGNWKRKWEQKTPVTGAMFLHSVLVVITLVFYLAMVIGLAL